MSNEAIYALVILAVVAAILINWRLNINLGIPCLVFAYVIGCIIIGMQPKTVVGFTPVNIVFQLAALTFFFSFPHQNGTLEVIANKVLYTFRNRAWFLPFALLFIGVLLGIIGAPNPMISIVIGVLGFRLCKKCNIHPVMISVVAALNGFGSNVLWTQAGTIISTTIAGLGYDQATAEAYAWKYFLLSAITFMIVVLIFYFITKGYKAKAPENMEKPAPFNATQRKTLAIVVIVVGLVILSNVLGVFVKSDAVATFKSFCDIQMLCVVGGFACILLKLGNMKEAIGKGIPWNTIIMISGIVVLLGVAQEAGVVEWLGGQISDSVPVLVIPAFFALITGLLSFFAGGITAIFPMLAPLVPAIAEMTGIPASTLFCCTAIGGNLTTISPFSTGGATVLSTCPYEEDQPKIFRGQLACAFTGLGVAIVLSLVGFFNLIPI